VVRELIKYLEIKPGLEIHYYGDLPARSGMGSSSCFTVGLMQSLYGIKKINLNKLDLAKKSIYFEQNVMKEVVGSQDQISASYGGFNKITFSKNNTIKVKKILSKENLKKLNKNLVLIYTGINRTAHKIASSYVKKLTTTKKNYIKNILEHVHEGEKILMSGNIDDFGKLLNSSWTLKKKLSISISNRQIDDLYNQAIYNGALGGKLLGAGGGGFLLMYMKKKYRENFFKRYPKIINMPFKFSNVGTEVIFKDLNR
jgi:D-glycero-alpha-D-manno-heptose-7-phosphate kinase